MCKKRHSYGKPKKKFLRGGGAIKERLFLSFFFQRSKAPTAIKLKGGGGLGLNGPAIKRKTFYLRLYELEVIVNNRNKKHVRNKINY